MTVVTTQPAKNDERQLPAARAKLQDAISALIDPRPEPTDNGTVWINPRYHELREALTTQRIGSRTAPGSQPPAWLDALDLLARIDRKAYELEPTSPILECDDYPAAQRLRAHAARKFEPHHVTVIATTANQLEIFVTSITTLFAPAPKYLPDPCPRCNKTTTTHNTGDETIRTPALQITDQGAQCNHCKATWTPDRLVFLGRLLGYRIQGIDETTK